MTNPTFDESIALELWRFRHTKLHHDALKKEKDYVRAIKALILSELPLRQEHQHTSMAVDEHDEGYNAYRQELIKRMSL